MNKSSMFFCLGMAVVAAVVCVMANTASADLVRYYALNETSGTVAADSSGNHANGTYNGVTLGVASANASLYGTAIGGFDGTNNTNVDLGTGLGNLTDNFSVAAWVKLPASLTANQAILGMTAWPSTSKGWMWEIDGSSAGNTFGQMEVTEPGYQSYRTSTPIIGSGDLGNWVHLAFTYSSTADQVCVYKNGSLFSTLTTGSAGQAVRALTADSTLDYTIGNLRGATWHEDLNGASVDEVRVYNNVLSASDVAGLASIPEPSAIALLATGLVSLLAYAWRKRR